MSERHRSLFMNHGCKVVEDTAFQYVNENTFLMCPYVCLPDLVGGLDGREITELAFFIGNGEGLLNTSNGESPPLLILFRN